MNAVLLAELIPWQAKRLAVATPPKMWAFNPSIVRYQGRTLCAVRLANYHMPGAQPAPDNPPRSFSKCAILELDDRLEVVSQAILDDGGRGSPSPSKPPDRVSRGFEDVRLFTAQGQLHASASSACTCPPNMAVIEISHLRLRESRIAGASSSDWDLYATTPLRGTWSSQHQKNWMPYIDHPSGEPRWLYSPERGGLHSPLARLTPLRPEPTRESQARPPGPLPRVRTPQGRTNPHARGGVESRILGGQRAVNGRGGPGTHGRASIALRGGTQLVRIPGSEIFLGLAHGYQGDGARKFYWHTWLAVDADGNLRGASKPFKLCEAGIEFAAGLVIDEASGQVAVSYGVDDDSAWVGVGALGDAIGMLPEGSVR